MPSTSAAAIVAVWIWLVSQSAGQPAGRQQPPTFRASTDLVEVDVNVTDRHGAFVPDLSLGDFTVFEEGKRRPIEVAYLVRSGNVSLASRGTAGAGASPHAAPSGRRVMVFYFDTTHMNFGQLRRAGAAAEQFLSSGLNHGDIGGVIVGDRMMNDRLTTDTAELLADVRAASQAADIERAAPTVPGAGTTGETTAPMTRSAMAGHEVADNLVDAKKAIVTGPVGPAELSTLRMLERLVDALARVPGRKNVVYFSGGFPMTGTMPGSRGMDELSILRRVTEKAAHSNVHIYSIDVVGLDKGAGSSAILTATQPEFADASAANAAHVKGEPSKEDVLTQLALDTGGLLFLNRNYYVDALKAIDDDSSNYYVLAFRPDQKGRKARKGAFLTLHVTVDRPDLNVRARKGYVAGGDPDEGQR